MTSTDFQYSPGGQVGRITVPFPGNIVVTLRWRWSKVSSFQHQCLGTVLLVQVEKGRWEAWSRDCTSGCCELCWSVHVSWFHCCLFLEQPYLACPSPNYSCVLQPLQHTGGPLLPLRVCVGGAVSHPARLKVPPTITDTQKHSDHNTQSQCSKITGTH
jgi:hypothetical protein